jgi:phosphosulfolactate synthase (CoM biosynthesis protein A)
MATAEEFQQQLYNQLSTVFTRTLGHSLDIRQIDQLNMEAKRLGDLITEQVNDVANKRALEVCKLLNDAVKAGFQIVAEEDNKLAERIATLENSKQELANALDKLDG